MVTLTHTDLIESFLALPNAPIILNELEATLAEEKKRRLDFYNNITDEQKNRVYQW